MDVRTHGEFDGTLGNAVRSATGPHPRSAVHLDVGRMMSLDASSIAAELGARAGHRSRRLLPQRLALGGRDGDPARDSGSTPATTRARGTSGRATTSCRSSIAQPTPSWRRSRERHGRAARPSSCHASRSSSSSCSSSASGRGRPGSSSVNQPRTWSRRTSGWNCTAQARSPARKRLYERRRRESDGAWRTGELVAVRVQRLELRREHAEHRIGDARPP